MFRAARCPSRLSTPDQGIGSYLVCEGRVGHRASHHTVFERWTDAEADYVTSPVVSSPVASSPVMSSPIPRQRDSSPTVTVSTETRKVLAP
jgi:hypothetical protein